MVFCGAILVSSQNANALSLGDTHELGFFWPGIQRKTDNQETALLIGMALGTIDVARGEVYSRSNHRFKSLPTAAWAHNGGGRAINLGAGGVYTYLLAMYTGYGAEVWYVANLNGIVRVPFRIAGHQLTGSTLFAPASLGVPDGGVTVMLLGVALGVVALARRFLMR